MNDKFDCFNPEPVPDAKPVPLYTKFTPPNVVGSKATHQKLIESLRTPLIISESDMPVDLPSK